MKQKQEKPERSIAINNDKNKISSYFQEWPAFEPEYDKMKYEGLNVSENKAYQNLKQKKRRLLDTVFKSMNNLVEFLEYVSESERLQDMFYDDLQQLLLGNTDRNPPTFYRFLNAALTKRGDNNKHQHQTDDYRLVLANIMTSILFIHVPSRLMLKVGADITNTIVTPDFSKVCAWTKLFASDVDLTI